MISVAVASFALVCAIQLISESFASCVHGGTKYEDGDHFPPNEAFIKIEDPLQCVQCRCQQGLVVCEIENCTFSDCEKPVKHPRFCCLQCSGDSTPGQGPSDSPLGQTSKNIILKKKESSNCYSNGQNYANGSVWQPVIGPFGTMACVRCECREGNVVCTRLRCNNQPCSHPRREFGECCPVCHDRESKWESTASCLPKSSELFVFKTPNVQNDSDTIEYAFLENDPGNNNQAVILHTWNLRRKISSNALTVKTSNREELEKWNLQLLGSATQKRFKKFSQRGERLGTKCFERCLKKINRLENSLGIRRVLRKGECARTEMDVSKF